MLDGLTYRIVILMLMLWVDRPMNAQGGLTADKMPRRSFHYRPADHAMGDIHPYYFDGVYYLHYLHHPGQWRVGQLRSTNLMDWASHEPTHARPNAQQVLPNYFVLGVIRDRKPDLFRTFYGSSGIRSSLSHDLLHWNFADPDLVLPDPGIYPRMSDPYVFRNGDQGEYGMVMTLEKKDKPREKNGAVGYATSPDLIRWTWRGELDIPVPIGVPECPSMFKMGTHWYLLASFQGAKGVGKPSYMMADHPRGPWHLPSVASLDGDQLCAAETCDDGKRRLLFGWVPSKVSPEGNKSWGGHLALPRVIEPLPDGRLTTRLPETIATAIRGADLFSETEKNLKYLSGHWSRCGNTLSVEPNGEEAVCGLPVSLDRFGCRWAVCMTSETQRMSFIIGETAVVLDRQNQRLSVGPLGAQYRNELQVPVPADEWLSLHVILEDDILECYLNEQYSLVTRLAQKPGQKMIMMKVGGGHARMRDLQIYHLAS